MIKIIQNFTGLNLDDLCSRGVYKIIIKNKPDLVYIGSTFCKKGFYARWYDHLRRLNKNIHYCSHLQNIYNKYGKANIKFEIIEVINSNKEDCYSSEYFYINKFDKTHNLLNTSREVFAVRDRVISKETRLKLHNANKGRCLHNKQIKLYQYNYFGKLIKEWSSIRECENTSTLKKGTFSTKCNIKYFKLYFLSKNKLNNVELKLISKPTRLRYNTQTRSILQYSLENIFIKEWESTKEACEHFNVSKTAITQALRGYTKTSCNYKWKYKNDKNDKK